MVFLFFSSYFAGEYFHASIFSHLLYRYKSLSLRYNYHLNLRKLGFCHVGSLLCDSDGLLLPDVNFWISFELICWTPPGFCGIPRARTFTRATTQAQWPPAIGNRLIFQSTARWGCELELQAFTWCKFSGGSEVNFDCFGHIPWGIGGNNCLEIIF